MESKKDSTSGSDQSKGQSRVEDQFQNTFEYLKNTYGIIEFSQQRLRFYRESPSKRDNYSDRRQRRIFENTLPCFETVKQNMITMLDSVTPQSKFIMKLASNAKHMPKPIFSSYSFLKTTEKQYAKELPRKSMNLSVLRHNSCKNCIYNALNCKPARDDCPECNFPVDPDYTRKNLFSDVSKTLEEERKKLVTLEDAKNELAHDAKMLNGFKFKRFICVLPLLPQKMMSKFTFDYYPPKIPELIQQSNAIVALSDRFFLPRFRFFSLMQYNPETFNYKLEHRACSCMNALFTHTVLPWTTDSVMLYNLLDQIFYSYNFKTRTYEYLARLEDHRVDRPFFPKKLTSFRHMKPDAEYLAWMIFIDENIMLCSSDKGNLYLVDFKYKFSRFLGHLVVDGRPALIRQIQHLENGFCVAIADRFMIELKIAFENPNSETDERVTIKPEKLSQTYFEEYERNLNLAKQMIREKELFLKMSFFNVGYRTKSQLISIKKAYDQYLVVDWKAKDKDEYKLPCSETALKKLSAESQVDRENIQKYRIFPKVLDKLCSFQGNQMPNMKLFKKVVNLAQVLKYHHFAVVVRFDKNWFEIWVEKDAGTRVKLCQVPVFGQIYLATVNDLLDQLIILTFDEFHSVFYLLIYNLSTFITTNLSKMDMEK